MVKYLTFLIVLWWSKCHAVETVIIGMVTAEKPPILIAQGSQGIVPEVISSLNKLQDKYYFKYLRFPTQRFNLYAKSKNKKIDILAYSNLLWLGDAASHYQPSKALMKSKEVFISLKEPGRNEAFFDKAGVIRTVGVRGYHYAFTGFETTEATLSTKFNMVLVNDEQKLIEMVLLGRAFIGVAEESSLLYFKARNPAQYSRLLISERADNKYERNMLVHRESTIKIGELNALIDQLIENEILDSIYHKHGLPSPKS